MSLITFQQHSFAPKLAIPRSLTMFIGRFLTIVHLNDRDLTQEGWQESACKLLKENTFIHEKIFAAQRMIPWDSNEGMARSQTSGIVNKPRFWQILRYSETQLPRYCGIASAVITLNAMSVSAKAFTQNNLVQSIPSQEQSLVRLGDWHACREDINHRGIALAELAFVLQQNSVKVITIKAADLTEAAIRKVVIPALRHPNFYVLALYLRGPLQESNGGGHWSPLLAFDQKSDSFLLLDVSRVNYSPKWVNASAFIQATRNRTKNNDWSRGFLILKK